MSKIVLVVEDFDDIRDAMRILIELQGYQVVEATDGHEAINRAKETRPDLILMDLSMPAFDGIEATREIKNDPQLRHIRIVAVTSHVGHYADLALAAGCDRVIDKPDLLRDMERLITELLSEV
jgi:CheY-like chemotaxis protein